MGCLSLTSSWLNTLQNGESRGQRRRMSSRDSRKSRLRERFSAPKKKESREKKQRGSSASRKRREDALKRLRRSVKLTSSHLEKMAPRNSPERVETNSPIFRRPRANWARPVSSWPRRRKLL